MPAKQTVVTKTIHSKTRTKKSTKSKSGRKGNPNRCPQCGRFM